MDNFASSSSHMNLCSGGLSEMIDANMIKIEEIQQATCDFNTTHPVKTEFPEEIKSLKNEADVGIITDGVAMIFNSYFIRPTEDNMNWGKLVSEVNFIAPYDKSSWSKIEVSILFANFVQGIRYFNQASAKKKTQALIDRAYTDLNVFWKSQETVSIYPSEGVQYFKGNPFLKIDDAIERAIQNL